MTYSPKKQIIVEAQGLTTTSSFSGGVIAYLFEPIPSSTNYWVTGGSSTISDNIGLVSVSGQGQALPVGIYEVNAEAVIEVNASGYGDTFTFGNISGTTPSLAYNQLNSNVSIVRSFSEYSIGSSDYVRTSLRFDLEVTNPQGLLSPQYANQIASVPFLKVVFTKVN